jgi:hypothetical protein
MASFILSWHGCYGFEISLMLISATDGPGGDADYLQLARCGRAAAAAALAGMRAQ